MIRDTWKNIGKSLFFIFILVADLYAARPFSLTVNTTTVGIGEPAFITIKLTGNEFSDLEIPEVDGLDIEFRGKQMMINAISLFGKSKKELSHTYAVTGERIGMFTIPPFKVIIDGKKYKTKPVQLKVTKERARRSGGRTTANRGGRIKVTGIVSSQRRNVYIGEPIVMRYYIVSNSEDIEFIGFNRSYQTNGFIYKQVKENDVNVSADNSIKTGQIKKYLFTLVLVPTQQGVYSIGGGTGVVEYEQEIDRDLDIFGRRLFPKSRIFTHHARGPVLFDSLKVKVLPLPKNGRMQKYQGNVGSFSIEARYDPAVMQQYDEKRVTVTIEGTGNLLSLSKPFFTIVNDKVKIISEQADPEITVQNNQLQGRRVFTYTMIPQKGGTINLGPLYFNFFDPDVKQYKTISTNDIVLAVERDSDDGDKEKLDLAGKTEIVYFNTTMVVLLVLGIGILVVLFFMWERKRYKEVVEEKRPKQKTEDKPDFDSVINEYLGSLKKAAGEGDSGVFLKFADMILVKCIAESPDRELRHTMTQLKEKIYAVKFGGGSLSGQEITGLLDEIVNLVNGMSGIRVKV